MSIVLSRQQIEYFGIPIEYELTIKKVKNLNVRINEEGKIFVSANKNISNEQINSFLESKAEWIIQKMAELERYNAQKPDNEIYTGKRLYFLGKAYSAVVEEGNRNFVEKTDDTIIITVLSGYDSEKIKKAYKKWLISQCEVIFKTVVDNVYSLVREENIPLPEIHIRNMKTRWGSCKVSSDLITLNMQLIKTDIKCIEQVALHELIHFIVPNHSQNFYYYLNKYMPDWKERKQAMEEKYKDGIF